VLFSSSTPLLDNDPGGAGNGLYLYTDSPNPETESNLTFIGRWQHLQVTGMSDDASHIYFYQNRTVGQSGMMMEQGVYLWDRGNLHFVARIERASSLKDVRLSADGKRMAFLDEASFDQEPGLVKPAPNQSVGINPIFHSGWLALYLYDEST
jgi:hypothetical protein